MEQEILLNDEDVALLLTLLRNGSQPATTQKLVDALRRKTEPGSSDAIVG